MTSYLIICAASLTTAALTMYSGFGLGTLLMPVFALFFPLELAVAATAVVHGANNIFKITMVGRYADRHLLLKFGLPALLAAFAGAAALGFVAHFKALASWSLGPFQATITPLKLTLGVLMFIFALFELLPSLKKIKLDQRWLVAGGLLSGFFGGFSGHQGALRSAFLAKTDIAPRAFVGTNAVIGFMVDSGRIATYIVIFTKTGDIGIEAERWPLIATAILAAFAGVRLAHRFLNKLTMDTIQVITGGLLLLIAISLASGLI